MSCGKTETALQKMLVLSSEIQSNQYTIHNTQYTKHHYLDILISITILNKVRCFIKDLVTPDLSLQKGKHHHVVTISFGFSSLPAGDSKCTFYTWIFKHLPGISLQMFHRQHAKHVYRYTNYLSLWTCLYAFYFVKCYTFKNTFSLEA